MKSEKIAGWDADFVRFDNDFFKVLDDIAKVGEVFVKMRVPDLTLPPTSTIPSR